MLLDCSTHAAQSISPCHRLGSTPSVHRACRVTPSSDGSSRIHRLAARACLAVLVRTSLDALQNGFGTGEASSTCSVSGPRDAPVHFTGCTASARIASGQVQPAGVAQAADDVTHVAQQQTRNGMRLMNVL